MIYDVFIDESGLFTETSSDPGDRINEHKRTKKFASQLAGIIVEEGKLEPADAWRVFKPACDEASIVVSEEFHSTTVKRLGGGVFDRLVIASCRCLEQSQIKPFRLVNRERVSFGNRKANYVNMVGELLVRICKELDRCDEGVIVLNIYQAGIKNSEYELGDLPFWEHDDFEPTLKTVFQRASISAGWAKESSKWQLGTFKFRSGTKDERLWLCDLISNASHDDFRTVSKQAAESLRASLRNFDFELSFNVTLEKVTELRNRDAFGMAIVELLEAILSPWASNEAKAAYADNFDRVLLQLLELPPLARSPQIQTVLGWLQQTADDRDRLSEAKFICKWFDERLTSKHEASIRSKDSALFSWVRLGITTASLTACNHSGDLAQGKQRFLMIDNLIPEIAGRWEYASDLMRSIVVQAVHLNDCFEHEAVSKKLGLVAGYYQGLGELFDSAYPGLFPDVVRSKVCGEALGTMVQAQIYLMLQGKVTVGEARRTSERAVEQFSDEADRKRQFQYRSEIECIASEWDSARQYLMRGIGASNADHRSLAKFIAELDSENRAFPLLHWTRIGGMAAIADAKDELAAFLAAWNASGLDSYIQKQLSTYPAHGILRRMAGVYAANANFPKMIETVRTLRSVVQANPTPLFRLIEAAGVMQAAGLAGRIDPQQMQRLIQGGKNDDPVETVLQKITKETNLNQLRISNIAEDFQKVINSEFTSETLTQTAKVVGY
jgi:hypothetical protein